MKRIKLSLRAALACVLMWTMLAAGCSYPDDPNWEAVKGAAAAVPPDQLDAIRRYELLSRFQKWMEGEFRAFRGRPAENAKQGREVKTAEKTRQEREDFEKQTFLDVECSDGGKTITAEYKLGEFEQCMSRGLKDLFTPSKNFGGGPVPPTRLFDECIKLFAQRAADSLVSAFDVDESHELNCVPKVVPKFDSVLDEGLSDEFTPEDLGRILISAKSPPPWAKWLGIVVVGGVVIVASPALGVALCALGADYACPPSADRLPGQTPQPDGVR